MEGETRMALEPFAELWVLMGHIIVEDDMDGLLCRDLSLDLVEEADELLMPMLLHAAPDDLAFEHVEGGKQGSGAVALIVVGMVAARPVLRGSPGWVRWSAWIWLFSSSESTMAWSGGSI